jgi:hypothetical protein
LKKISQTVEANHGDVLKGNFYFTEGYFFQEIFRKGIMKGVFCSKGRTQLNGL